MLADYHIHSDFSDDSKEPMENIIIRAMELSFDEICFTDHVDYGIKFDYGEEIEINGKQIIHNVDYETYLDEIQRLQTKYENKLVIKKGLEFGIQTHTIEKYEQLFQRCGLDFVLLSCHQVDDQEFWNHEFQKGKTAAESNHAYYAEIEACIKKYKNYSVLAHLDMIQRYNETLYPFEQSKEIIARILATVIADGKGIEVNTSSFRYGLKDLTPAREILELYRVLGGTILTIGSDCHKAQDFGDHIIDVRETLKEIGFTQFCTFEKMNPIYHAL